MYSVVMVVAMTGAPEVPACDWFCHKPKMSCATTQVCCTPKPVSCCPQPTCHVSKGCCLLKCFSFCNKGHGHASMAPSTGCGEVVIPPQGGTVVTPPTDVKKDMPKVEPKPADPKTGPAPKIAK